LALVTFLGLKNTPLAVLTAYSYERINILHQAAGYCTVLEVVLHAILQIVSEAQRRNLAVFLERNQIMAIVAGLSLLATLTAALVLKRLRYEIFYIVHIALFMLILISVGMHRPNLSDKTVYIVIFTASIWAADRVLRASRLLVMAFGNHATVAALEHDGVRISLRRTPWRARGGSHIFLCIPRIRPFEAHPFTVISTNPLELVVAAQDGFTRDLLSYASANPGAALRVSCDGPYGTLPDFSKFNQVVLIAGGSGASFTFGVALNLIKQTRATGHGPKIHFTWVIRKHSSLFCSSWLFTSNKRILRNQRMVRQRAPRT
jgi:predicted ferric reductase